MKFDPRVNAVHQRPTAIIWRTILLGGLLFLPGAIAYLYEGTSFANGTALLCLIALLLAALRAIPYENQDVTVVAAFAGAAFFLIGIHLLVANIINNDPSFDVGRAFLSLILLTVIIMSVPAISGALMGSSNIKDTSFFICGLFILIAVFSLLKIQPPTESLGDKPTFPYTEPSFFGFSFPAVLLFSSMRLSIYSRAVLIGTFFLLGYALSNLTIIVSCMLVSTIALPISVVGTGLFVFVVGAASLDLSYYTDRLSFDWSTSTNLSSLVYVQGWQMLQESLEKTGWWGVGFQQLGIVYTNVPASVRINALLGRDANLQDGGFILSKLGSEFGFIGLLAVAALIYVAAQSFVRLRLLSWRRQHISDGELFARACVLGYLVEVLARGTNYFTGTFVLMLAGLFHLRRMKAAAPRALMSPQ